MVTGVIKCTKTYSSPGLFVMEKPVGSFLSVGGLQGLQKSCAIGELHKLFEDAKHKLLDILYETEIFYDKPDYEL